ncbi:MAG: DNA polymerase/3'-5' exonuclease PolX [Actinomycetota bacterium]|nr:DNA polymerase/3'-5' exonuclease PolX [Actinomycetota bacterium]
MPLANSEVSSAFAELADLIEIAEGDHFKIVAYRRASEEISALSRDVAKMSRSELMALRGIGSATAAKISEILETGTMAKLEEMRALVPAGLREMTKLPGLGPKKALLIHRELGVTTLAGLKDAIDNQQVREVKGLGPKTEESLARVLRNKMTGERRVLLDLASEVAETMIAELSALKAVKRIEYAGSLRRMRETIGDIDLLVASTKPALVMDAFVNLTNVAEVAAKGPTKSSVITKQGLQVDLRVVAPDEFGAALQYFTGSQSHNVKVREIAVKKGFKLSEYGLFKVPGDQRVAAETEEDVYAALGMQTPSPTMRENRGEVEAASRSELPKVVTLADIRGDLHSHSLYSDGIATIEEMAMAAMGRGYEYWAITDHGRNIHVNSLSLEKIERQRHEVAALNRKLAGKLTILRGVELNIGADGGLDYPDEVLAEFDVVVASIHQSLTMKPEAMTERIVRALSHPAVNIFGHPTSRRLGQRPPIEYDMAEVFKTAAANQVALEINASPSRLDLKDDHIRAAAEFGCMFSIDTDAHAPLRLDRMRLGVGMAQRGWLTKEQVIGCMPLKTLKRFLTKAR